jgi:leukemia factor-related protein
MNGTTDAHIPGWQGLTIKEILEKVDLFNISAMVEDDKKVNTSQAEEMKPSGSGNYQFPETNSDSAFLGPRLWNKPISLPVNLSEDEEPDFSVMNIEEFLNENNIEMDGGSNSSVASPGSEYENNDDFSSSEQPEDEPRGRKRPVNVMKGTDTNFLYAESKAARMEREREEKRKQALKVQMEFAPEDLALATIPGMSFDPRERAFSIDELRPQPIIRKRKKSYVPSESKNEKYWEKRVKNNVAARRSREARRLKENQIALRAAFLEKENFALKDQVKKIDIENKRLAAEKEALLQQLKALQHN